MYSKLHFIYLSLFIGFFEQPSSVICIYGTDDSNPLYQLGWEVHCKLQPDTRNCTGTIEYRFYYDVTMGACKTFTYWGCEHNFNSFSTLPSCSRYCSHSKIMIDEEVDALQMNVSCHFQQDFGTCNDYQPMFYYDYSIGKCRSFSYSGCGGNRNRFTTENECLEVCAAAKLTQP